MPDALAQGADTLVSIGGYQSNHTRQVAAVAAHLGMGCVLVQENWVDWPDAVNDRVGNILLSRIMGAEVRLDPAGFDIGFRDSWKQAIADVEAARRHAVRHPGRRQRPPARRSRFRELGLRGRAQEAQLGVFFDTIVVCTVTGSTHAGMIAGFAGSRIRRRGASSASTPRRRSTRPATRSRASPGARRSSSTSAATCATTRSPCSRAGPATSTASRSSRRSTRFASPASSRASSSTRSTRASRWPA